MVQLADPRMDIEDRRAQAECGVSHRLTRLAVAIFFALALLLNGHHIYEEATQRPYGFWWTVWVSAMKPLDRISTLTRLSVPRSWIENMFGQTEDVP